MKKETVLTIATLLAVVSAFFIKPDRQYIGYIDFRTLGILFGLMVIMQGFQRTGLFDRIGKKPAAEDGKALAADPCACHAVLLFQYADHQ